MGYSKELYEQATAVLAQRRLDSQTAAAALRERVVQRVPRAAEVERRLTLTGIQVAREVLQGLDGHRTGDIAAAMQRLQAENERLQRELAACIHEAGETADNFDPVPVCPRCGDTGYVGQHMCGCLTQLLRDAACRELSALSHMTLTRFEDMDMRYYSNLPDEESGLSPRTRMQDVVAFCRAYAADFSRQSPNLLLRGPAGTGKTHVSLAIAREVAESGHSVIYGSVQRLLRQLEKEHFGREEGESADRMEACDLLILDDLGTEFASPFYTSALYELINVRLLDERPTIISTNLNQKQLREHYGVQIASRVAGCFQPLLFAGSDIRQQKQMRRLRPDEG